MSRIFDALRRSEQENKHPAPPVTSAQKTVPELLERLQARRLSEIQRIICRASQDEPLVAGQHPRSLGAEKFRTLTHRLRQVRVTKPLRRILVTSSVPREGKTFVALNLALTLAASSNRVALLDTDMRQSGLNRLLGLPQLPGLADYLEGRIEATEAFRLLEPYGVHYVSSGNPTCNPVDLLQSGRMRDLMAEVENAFDWVLLDSPPLNPVADAHCLATLADGVLLVVRAGHTRRDLLENALSSLGEAKVAGIVLNGSTEFDQQHYYQYYYSAPPTTTTQEKKEEEEEAVVA